MRHHVKSLLFIGMLPLVLAPARESWGVTAPASVISAASALIPAAVPNGLVGTFGLAVDDRPFEPATLLTTGAGMDIGFEVSLPKVPIAPLTAAINGISSATGGGSSGLSASSLSTIPVIPVVNFSIHKNFGGLFDVGVNFWPSTGILSNYVSGTTAQLLNAFAFTDVDVKVVVYHPDEGPTVAARFCLSGSWINIPGSYPISVYATTYSPQILVSKKLDFADPFIGASVQYAVGSFNLTYSPPAPFDPFVISQGGSAWGAMAFGGVSMKVPYIGMQLTMEGGFSSVGADYIGMKLGVSF